MEKLRGIKLMHRSFDTGVLRSFIGGSKWRNRMVTYKVEEEVCPNLGCGPLAVYEGTKEGLNAAMKWVKMYTEGTVAVFSCLYVRSKECE